MSNTGQPERRRANDNHWYCLATLYGEQTTQLDEEIATKNRIAWNRWMTAALSDDQRADLARNGLSESELAPLNSKEKAALCKDFASRINRGGVLPPDPTEVVSFTNTQFDNLVNFVGFLYVARADFTSAIFSNRADFASATFFSNVAFTSTNFCDYADFTSGTFSGDADFESAAFSGDAYFKSATFSATAEFASSKFFNYACFESAGFASYAGFVSVTFSAYADFESATFGSRADFKSATFSDDADFESATFSGNADFESTRFSGSAGFSSATFSKDAVFVNVEFTARTVFADVRFEAGVPDFRGAKMHEATEWHAVAWPPAPQAKDAAQAQVYAYERLKQEMERLKKHEDEQFFFRKELRARRGLVPPRSGAWLLNYLYEASSDYGQSIGRPLLWLLGVFTIGAAFFAGTPVFNGSRMPILRAAGLSFANVFSFLPLKREIMTTEMIDGLSSAAQIIGVVQSLLGLLLLFLAGLALRNRFRMR
jgi:hypothetical protein